MPDHKGEPIGSTAPSGAQETSMEEIIASISRMIAADGKHSARPATNPDERKSAILELTEVVEPDESVRRLPSPGVVTAAEAPPEPAAAFGETAAGKSEATGERILSPTTAEAVATSLARLAAIAPERRPGPDPMSGAGVRTLEESVRDMLRPLLQAWLDEHLPALV